MDHAACLGYEVKVVSVTAREVEGTSFEVRLPAIRRVPEAGPLGRLQVWPSATTPARDLIFAATRKDGEVLEGVEFAHCTFANVSFKDYPIR